MYATLCNQASFSAIHEHHLHMLTPKFSCFFRFCFRSQLERRSLMAQSLDLIVGPMLRWKLKFKQSEAPFSASTFAF